MASGAPEHSVASIDVSQARIDAVMRRRGPPERHTNYTDPRYPAGSGQGEYVWELGGLDLQVTTLFYTGGDGKRVESITGVTVFLARAQAHARFGTGRGVQVGDTAKTVRKLYGRRYAREDTDSYPRMKYCFSDDTRLHFRFDARGRVDEIMLERSVE